MHRSPSFRRRAAMVAAVLALYALIRFVPLPGIPCGLSAVKDCGSGAAAIALVPADAYVFAHAELDPDEAQVEAAAELAGRLPHFEEILAGVLRSAGLDPGIDVQDDVRPWLGDEAALAVLPGKLGAPAPLALLAVDDEPGAEDFLGSLGGAATVRSHRGTDVSLHSGGLASARRDDFLLLGGPASVRAAIDASLDGDASLEADDAADDVLGALPDERLADAYVSGEGISRLLRRSGGLGPRLDTFVDYGASTGLAAAAVATDDGIRVEVHSALDPERVRAEPGFFAAFPPFEPRLAEELSPRTLGLLEIGDVSSTIRSLLEQADAAVPGISAAFDRLNADLSRGGAVDLEEGLLPLLRGRAAAALAVGRGSLPYITFAFDDVDEDRVGEAVARLQAPLIQALDPVRTGVAPSFSEERIGDVVAQSVRLTPAVDLTYAVFDGKLVVSTSPTGVRRAVEGDDSLAGEDGYETVTQGASDGVSALVFLDLAGLVELAEPAGLGEIVAGFREDLDRLGALGLTVRGGESALDTTIFLEIR